MGKWNTGLHTGQAAHNHLLTTILPLGFDPSQFETPSLIIWPAECSPKPEFIEEHIEDEDSFFIDWIASILKVSPGEIPEHS
jgi:hypothetical protein